MMKATISGIILLFIAVFIFTGFVLPENTIKEIRQSQPITHETLPNILLVKPDGSQVFTKNLEGKSIIVLFQPDCDHCQREAVQIREHLKAFRDYNMYFVSSAPIEEIEQFSEEYNLKGNPNVFFAYTDLMNILNNFGAVQTPSLYIYSEEQKLIKAFNGETAIGQILQHI